MCVLAGIPIVSSAWIKACLSQQQVAMPLDSMWVRSLPMKSQADNGTAVADFGVAKMAVNQRGGYLFEQHTVHLFGHFGIPAKADVLRLLREAGATVSSQVSLALSRLEDIDSSNRYLILLCDDGCTGNSDILYRQMKAALQKQRSIACKGSALVVKPQWLFDSIVCGSVLPGDAYAPTKANGQPHELWRLLHQ
jgi:hypothetical protein